MMRARIDDWPFRSFGARGCFGHAFLTSAPGDGVRAAWTVMPALPGVEVRPATGGPRAAHPRHADADDTRKATAMATDACDLYVSMLAARLPAWAVRWRARVTGASWKRCPLQRAHHAFYGGPYCDGRLDVGIHDATRAIEDDAFLSASCSFGHLVWDFGDSDNALWVAQRCGEFAARSLSAAGEAAWSVVDRAVAL